MELWLEIQKTSINRSNFDKRSRIIQCEPSSPIASVSIIFILCYSILKSHDQTI